MPGDHLVKMCIKDDLNALKPLHQRLRLSATHTTSHWHWMCSCM